MTSQQDNRQLPRIALKHPATLNWQGQTFQVELTNLSEKGCAFLSPICLADHATGTLEFDLMATHEHFNLKLQIEVIHCYKTRDTHLVGVTFNQLNTMYQYALRKIVAHHLEH